MSTFVIILQVVSNVDFTMFSNIGAVGAANNYAGEGHGSGNANPYGPAGNNPMPSHFRRQQEIHYRSTQATLTVCRLLQLARQSDAENLGISAAGAAEHASTAGAAEHASVLFQINHVHILEKKAATVSLPRKQTDSGPTCALSIPRARSRFECVRKQRSNFRERPTL